MRVISATRNNIPFLNNLLQKNTAVVFFTAPWCGHCRTLEPILNKIMGRFSTSRREGVIANVSEGDIKNLDCDNDVGGFPTIRVLKKGKKVKDYEGVRDEKSINTFLAGVFNENMKNETMKAAIKTSRTPYSFLLKKQAKKAKRKAKKATLKEKKATLKEKKATLKVKKATLKEKKATLKEKKAKLKDKKKAKQKAKQKDKKKAKKSKQKARKTTQKAKKAKRKETRKIN